MVRHSHTLSMHALTLLLSAGKPKMVLHYGDLTDSTCLVHIVSQVQPDEIYNLAAQSHVKVSFDMADYTGQVDALGTLRLLDAIRTCNLTDKVRFYQASTSELYGQVQEIPQRETTPFYPRSPYGVAKLYGYWIVKNYREAYGMYACNGILFNHESPRRGAGAGSLFKAGGWRRSDALWRRLHVCDAQDLAGGGDDQAGASRLRVPWQPER